MKRQGAKTQEKGKIAVWACGLGVCWLFALSVDPAWGGEPKPARATVAVSDDALMQRWLVMQDECAGRPDGSSCGKRDEATTELEARGYTLHNHAVWTSPSDAGHFDGVVVSTQQWAATKSPLMMVMAGPTMRQSLRNHLSDDKILAIWNDSKESIRNTYPRAWSMLELQMKQVAADHARENDPRFTLDP
ncbi:hypothetical protein [Xanthomonas euvesicatoria]|uniref:hypothetical protein n=1 Tax=Xanthomonas euvesicatoria TaxID=456327 RepID=UPI003891CADB